ncbi:phage terminase large subunit [Azospirillum doebereinerae]
MSSSAARAQPGDRALLRQALREDLASFIHRSFQTVTPGTAYRHNWHIDAIAWHLQGCLTGRIRRLVITLPPRYLKSVCASVAFPAWALGHDPGRRIIAASYAQELAAKHARDCRAVMESGWYREVFPSTRLDPAKNTELEFATTARGFRLATSVGGTLTGRGGTLILIDDPMKPGEAMSEARRAAVRDWYDGTLYSRLDDKTTGVIVLIMQRLHLDDLVGHVLGKEEWVRLDLPAIAETPQSIPIGDGEMHERAVGEVLHPEREPLDTLDRIKATLGSLVFSAQYQQAPVPAGGTLVKWAWFRRYGLVPERQRGDQVVQSWDTAAKASELNDYTVCSTWLVRGPSYFLLDVRRERLEFPALRRQVVELADLHRADAVLIEDKGSGTQLIQELRHEGMVRPIAILPEADKVTRLHGQTARIEAGQVLLPAEAPWLDDFQAEVLAFPHGRHDDQVDSLSQFLAWVSQREWNVPRIRSL